MIWGNTMIGESTTSGIQWGGLATTDPNRVVWGELKSLTTGSTAVSWGNLERANMELK